MSNYLEALLFGTYPYFAVLALIGIVLRIRRGAWSRLETLLLTLWGGHLVVMALLPVLFYGDWDTSRRYFLVTAPLLFGWAAVALQWGWELLQSRLSPRRARWLATLAVTVAALALYCDAAGPVIKAHTSQSKRRARIATLTIADWLRQESAGHAATVARPLLCDEYRSNRWPVVFSRLDTIGYLAGGQNLEVRIHSDGIAPDYLVLDRGQEVPRLWPHTYHRVWEFDGFTVWRLLPPSAP